MHVAAPGDRVIAIRSRRSERTACPGPTQRVAAQERISDDNEYFRGIRESWSDALRAAYRDLPAPPWMKA
jgi:hypothetical protein